MSIHGGGILGWAGLFTMLLPELGNAEDELHYPSECALFVENAHSTERATRTRETLSYVDPFETYILVGHSGQWSTPEEVRFRGLDVLNTRTSTTTSSHFDIALNAELGQSAKCPEGRYRLSTDSSFGPRGQIIKVLDGVVLLEYEGQLRYLRTQNLKKQPVWAMVWVSPWSLSAPSQTRSSPSSPTRTRAPSKHARSKNNLTKRK